MLPFGCARCTVGIGVLRPPPDRVANILRFVVALTFWSARYQLIEFACSSFICGGLGSLGLFSLVLRWFTLARLVFVWECWICLTAAFCTCCFHAACVSRSHGSHFHVGHPSFVRCLVIVCIALLAPRCPGCFAAQVSVCFHMLVLGVLCMRCASRNMCF